MPYEGFQLNSKHSDPWISAIGKFMINFGGIEWMSFVWVDRLTQDVVLKELAVEMPLGRRIGLVRRLLEEASISKKLFNEAKSAWGSAEALSKLRNAIAHNPLVFGWHGPEEDRPPDFIGSLNFKLVGAKSKGMSPLLELKALTAGIDDAARYAAKLHELIEAIGGELKPNQSLEPTRVGKPPLAAQLQR